MGEKNYRMNLKKRTPRLLGAEEGKMKDGGGGEKGN